MNYRAADLRKGREEDRYNRNSPIVRKTYSPSNQNLQHRLTQYETLAVKAKQQLKQFESKRKHSPEVNKYQPLVEQKLNQKNVLSEDPSPNKAGNFPKILQHTYSHKQLRKEKAIEETKYSQKDHKFRLTHHQPTRADKLSQDGKVDSPKKKYYIDSNQYKKLHEKLDLIENKITDMKKNLQKKKEEKQKNQSPKNNKSIQLEKKSGLKDLVTKMPEHSQLHTFNSNPYSPRHNVYYVSQLIRAYKDGQSLAREHLVSSLHILKLLERSKRLSESEVKKISVNLPRKKGYEDKKTVIFDLDETLIHCNDNLNPPFDIILPIKFPTGQTIEAGINIRPYSKQILKNLSKYFQIILFTASHSCYANVVIDHLDPNREFVHHRLYREHCFLSPEGMYVKDLRIINRSMKDMVLVDNAAYSYAYQLENGIPIFPYYHGQVDFELKMLEQYLLKLAFCNDVRQVNQNTFKLTQYKSYYNRPQKLVQQLYINK